MTTLEPEKTSNMMKPVPHALPDEALKELVHDADMNDERLWVPRGDDVWSLPLLFNVASGSWVNITRAKGDGVISRHRHPAAVTGYTLEGAWGYLEHDWTAKVGTFVFEPPGETHTLVVRPDPGHMTVLFHNFGPLIKVDRNGETVGFEDVFTRLEATKAHYQKVGLGAGAATRLVR